MGAVHRNREIRDSDQYEEGKRQRDNYEMRNPSESSDDRNDGKPLKDPVESNGSVCNENIREPRRYMRILDSLETSPDQRKAGSAMYIHICVP